jgi:Fe-S oxidoreductase
LAGILLAAGLLPFAWVFGRRMRLLAALRPLERTDRIGARLRALLVFGLGQKRMLDPEERRPGLMHAFIFAAFMVLALRTISLFAMGLSASALAVLSNLGDRFWSAHPALTALYRGYLVLKDVVVALALIGVAYFAFFRLRVRPDRLRTGWQAFLILGLIAGLMITEIAFSTLGRRPIGELAFWLHLVIILVFLNLLPLGKHFHVITALPNVFFLRLWPAGRLDTPDLDREEYGVRSFRDLSRKQGLDLYSCTECGRCQTHCPTYLTHKPLTHKAVNRTLLEYAKRNQGRIVKTSRAELEPLVGPVLDPETVWACTTCGWCETACPVFIENVPRLIDMRRFKVQVDAEFPQEAQRAFEGMERQGNPWGVGQDQRAAWEQGLPAGLEVPTFDGTQELLFFVGCAGATDERQKKVSRAMVELLVQAGVSFGTLKTAERCNGDSARRLGNEYLFQNLARANVELFEERGVRRILTQCPHCWNTLRNEYPVFGGRYQVTSHAEWIAEQLKQGRLKVDGGGGPGRVTFHDPCYLGRLGGVIDPPREALRQVPGLELVEMPRSGRQSFCCGAGGGRMWLEERIGERINRQRVNEAAFALARASDPSLPAPDPEAERRAPGSVGRYEGPAAPGTIAVACPFCSTMMHDGIAETRREEELRVKDIAELVRDATKPKGPARG